MSSKYKYRRISIYFDLDDSQDSLRSSFYECFGNKKKILFDKMLDQFLKSYGVNQIEDLTLRDLKELKKEIIAEEEMAPPKRPRGRPRKNVEPVSEKPKTIEKGNEEKVEAETPKVQKQELAKDEPMPEVKVEKEEVQISQPEPEKVAEQVKQPVKAEESEQVVVEQPKVKQNPLATSIEDDDEEDELDTDLLSEMSAFF